jgi:cytidine deaminase
LDRRRPPGSDGAWRDRRRSSERRSGGDRREPGDRRSGHDRRSGRDRRGEDLGPPPGVPERRSGGDRRSGERRSGQDRRDDAGWAAIPIDQVVVDAFDYEDVLVEAARAARSRARARYSGFRVGAALETIDGQIVTGCNIENASYGLTTCAERVALLKALSDGHEVFTRLVVVADSDEPTTPCGPCRQLLWEYCGDIQVILASPTDVKRRYQLGRLLPMPFDHRHLK